MPETITQQSLPYITADLPGIGGILKERPEDFNVTELPLYEPSDQGEHVFCEIQKTGMTTFQVIDRLAAELHVSSRDIGYAGMKDAHSVSRQNFSILGTTPEQVMSLATPGMSILWATRHGNKLRLGHLAGNRFVIKVRKVAPTDVVKLAEICKRLQDRGVPNYFGEQRFGYRADNDKLGAALVRGDDQGVLKLLLGTPRKEIDDPQSMQARAAFDAGDTEEAMRRFPRRCGMERRILAGLNKTQNPRAAVGKIDQRLRRLWISALQSSFFNQVVARRIDSLHQVLQGDLAYKHDSGAVFLVEDAVKEQPRADAFEISPAGPLIGYRLTMPQGDALKIEQEVFDAAGIHAADFRVAGKLKVKGARRSMRFRPKDMEYSAGVDANGSYITAAFTLPAGAFATVVMRELMKGEASDASIPQEAEQEETSDETPTIE